MFERLNQDSRTFLSKGYLSEGQTAEERLRIISDNAERILGIEGFSDKLYGYLDKGYYSLSTPVWVNYGCEKGLPISCNSISVGDSIADIMKCAGELGVMSKLGAGVGTYFGNLRGRGSVINGNGLSDGVIPFISMYDKVASTISQGSSRRGFTSPYLDIDHADIEEFLEIGSEGNEIQRCTTGVVITDERMNAMIEGDKEKRKIRAKVIQSRCERGFPYIMFKGNVNNQSPQCYKDKGLIVDASNICSEAVMHIDENHSFVCCLASINVLYRDEIKETDAVETLLYFLDSVMEEYIQKLEKLRFSDSQEDNNTYFFMRKAYSAAKRERALGLGVLGYHHYLQSKMIAFENAQEINIDIFKTIQERCDKATKEMAEIYGEPELLQGYGVRNSHRTMVAPTTSSSFILGAVSQSIEPCMSNFYTKDLAKIKVTIKNPYLEKILKEKGENTKDVRDSIRDYDGSVQHLEFLSREEKEVFKTFREIDMQNIIDQAAERQKYICQSQSLNLLITPSYSAKEISNLLIDAWKKGVKTLYYQHSVSKVQEVTRKKKLDCIGCSS